MRAARAAYEGVWKDTPASARGRLLSRLAAVIEAEKLTLATIETWENGELESLSWPKTLGYGSLALSRGPRHNRDITR